MPTLKELCLAPENGGSFAPERLTRIEQALIEDRKTDMPWYLRSIVAIGAWLASLFFLGFAIVLVGWQEQHRQTIGVGGVVLLVVAVLTGRQKWGIFIGQCSLAVGLAAQAMIYYGFLPDNHPFAVASALSIGLAALLYVVYPDFLSRLITCLAALQITLVWIYMGDHIFDDSYRVQSEIAHPVTFFWALHLVGICWCFMRTRHSALFAPLGYAFIISFAAWNLENLSNIWFHATVISYSTAWVAWTFYHLRLMLVALTLFGVSVWAAGGIPALRQQAPLFIGLALALAALVWLGAGGVLLALLFLLLGFSLQNGAILGLGLLLLPIFLTHYYYWLNLDLLVKSGVLVGSGAVLLALRAGLQHLVIPELKEAA